MFDKRKFPKKLADLISVRKENFSLRKLNYNYPIIDFSSNDYLGFSSHGLLNEELQSLKTSIKVGSTGSRLISGNSSLFNEVETEIAAFHHDESALIFNSGYDANVGLLSSVPQKGDLILYDELIHASIIDGVRLSFATHYKFEHNSIIDLEQLLKRHKNSFNGIYIVVESVYSMDGDCSPLKEIVALTKTYNSNLIVDEAHAIGVLGQQGRGLCNELNIEKDCFARIYTYGKALGCHGASVVGSNDLKEYLINYARSFIYTTAMPEHSLLAIKAAYILLEKTNEIEELKKNIEYFNNQLISNQDFIESKSAIHCVLKSGNIAVQQLEEKLSKENFFVKSIKSPTVKTHQERIRICLHSFNTKEEIDKLLLLISQ
jgi:8-amino-7-oxononanoate synthase